MRKCLLVIQDTFTPEKQHFMLTGLRQPTLKPAPMRGARRGCLRVIQDDPLSQRRLCFSA